MCWTEVRLWIPHFTSAPTLSATRHSSCITTTPKPSVPSTRCRTRCDATRSCATDPFVCTSAQGPTHSLGGWFTPPSSRPYSYQQGYVAVVEDASHVPFRCYFASVKSISSRPTLRIELLSMQQILQCRRFSIDPFIRDPCIIMLRICTATAFE
jgi:hypothetical protein